AAGGGRVLDLLAQALQVRTEALSHRAVDYALLIADAFLELHGRTYRGGGVAGGGEDLVAHLAHVRVLAVPDEELRLGVVGDDVGRRAAVGDHAVDARLVPDVLAERVDGV